MSSRLSKPAATERAERLTSPWPGGCAAIPVKRSSRTRPAGRELINDREPDMPVDLVAELAVQAASDRRRIVFADGAAEEVVAAAHQVVELDVAIPILVGDPVDVAAAAARCGVDIEGFEIARPGGDLLDELVVDYGSVHPGFPESAARRLLGAPLNLAAMLVRRGHGDALVAGFGCPTGEVVATSQLIIGLAEGAVTPSSVLVMEIPNYAGPEGNLLAFADCAVVPAPSVTELADIAVDTASTVRDLLGWEPRVAMLSFSTRGSASDPHAERVAKALELVRARVPDLAVDGALQVDAALDPAVAAKKVPDGSAVAGRANVLIFPDLQAGNIAYKLVQRLAGAGAYGPLLQGFARPVSDLSRGARVEDIVATAVLTAIRAQTQV